MTEDILKTKLHFPQIRPNLVMRSRLVHILNEGLFAPPGFGRKVTLIAAPAGYGKTTLIADWISRFNDSEEIDSLVSGQNDERKTFSRLTAQWLSLDENDNEMTVFLRYLIIAFRSIDEAVGRMTMSLLEMPSRPPVNALMTPLINDLAAFSNPFILVLDDYHHISAPRVHQVVDFLLERQPTHLHLVIGTREDPPLHLNRLRARNQLIEIRMDDLRFSGGEAEAFLNNVMGLDLAPGQVKVLGDRTEGWITGLQLAALSLRGRSNAGEFIKLFTGSNRYVLDFLVDEVFAGQPEEIQEFLLKSSILNRFTAALCQEVIGYSTQWKNEIEVQLILEQLDAANLFLISLDDERRWYRYHHLFGDLLRHRLHRMDYNTRSLHRKAGLWLATEGYISEAVPHALKAEDWELAADLILGISNDMMIRGEVTPLLQWIEALPDEVIRSRSQLCLDYAWVLILADQLEAADEYLSVLDDLAQEGADLRGQLLTARVHMARMRNDMARTITLSEQALELLPVDDDSARSILSVNMGIALRNTGQLSQALDAFTEAQQAALRSGNSHSQLIALGFRGLILAAQGDLLQSARLLRRTLASYQNHPANALILRTLAALQYEWNEVNEAVEYLNGAMASAKYIGNAEILGGIYRQMAWIKQQTGDPGDALDMLKNADQLVEADERALFVRACNAACHVQIALSQGDLTSANYWLKEMPEPADTSPFYPRLNLTPARILLAQGDKDRAGEQLASCYEIASDNGWQYGLIETLSLRALAATDVSTALSFLKEAFVLAEPEGFVRTFTDKGEPMAELLQQAKSWGIRPTYVTKLLNAMIHGRYLPVTLTAEVVQPFSGLEQQSPIAEPLSDREIQIMNLLVKRRTNAEIAQELTVSVNTVKSHLQHIYTKLDVHDRRAAAAKAESLNLFPNPLEEH